MSFVPTLPYLILIIVASALALEPVQDMETPSSPRTLIDPLIEILQQSHRFPASRSSALSPRQVTQPHSAYSDVRAHHQEGTYPSAAPANDTLSVHTSVHMARSVVSQVPTAWVKPSPTPILGFSVDPAVKPSAVPREVPHTPLPTMTDVSSFSTAAPLSRGKSAPKTINNETPSNAHKPSTLLHWLANWANWLAWPSGTSAQQATGKAPATLLQLSKDSKDKDDKDSDSDSGGSPIGLIAAGIGGVCFVSLVVVLSAVFCRKSRASERRLKRQQSDHGSKRRLSDKYAPKLFQSMGPDKKESVRGTKGRQGFEGKQVSGFNLQHEQHTGKEGFERTASEKSPPKSIKLARTESGHPEESLMLPTPYDGSDARWDPVDELVVGASVRHDVRGEGKLIEIDLDNPMEKPYLVIFNKDGDTHRYSRKQFKDKFEFFRHPDSINISDVAAIDAAVQENDELAQLALGAQRALEHTPSSKRRAGAQPIANLEHQVSHSLGDDDPPCIGPTLVVQIVSARNLTAKDDNGTSDPFCTVAYGKQTRKTHVCLTTLNPAWNVTFRFELQYRAQLIFTVWDDDTNEGGTEADSDFLGKVDFKPQQLQDMKASSFVDASDDWYPLQKRSMMSHVSGDIRLRFSWEDFREL